MGVMVATFPIDQQKRVRVVCQQVRVLQAQLRGQDANTRRKLMEAEIDAAVKAAPEALRGEFVREMTTEFSRGAVVMKKVVEAAPAPRVFKPAEAVDVLVGAWTTLDEATKKALAEKLRPLLGGGTQDAGPLVDSAARALQVKAKEQVNLERLGAAFIQLVRLARYLDEVWGQWPTIARAVKRPEEAPKLSVLLRALVAGQPGGADASKPGARTPSAAEQEKFNADARRAVEEEVKKLGATVSQMMFELPTAIADFATEHVERLSSAVILEEVRRKKLAGMMGSEKVPAWDIFVARASEDLQEEAIVRKLTEHLEVRVRNAFQGRDEATG